MKTVNVQAAKTHLSRLIEEVVAGREIILAKAGKPLVRMVPYAPVRKPRVPGAFKGQFHESPGCWDPDPELEALFYRDDPLLSSKPVKSRKPRRPALARA